MKRIPGAFILSALVGTFTITSRTTENIKLRTRDPRYLNEVKSCLEKADRVLGPLQITHVGRIIMAQVENEYGFFVSDRAYKRNLKKLTLKFNHALFY